METAYAAIRLSLETQTEWIDTSSISLCAEDAKRKADANDVKLSPIFPAHLRIASVCISVQEG